MSVLYSIILVFTCFLSHWLCRFPFSGFCHRLVKVGWSSLVFSDSSVCHRELVYFGRSCRSHTVASRLLGVTEVISNKEPEGLTSRLPPPAELTWIHLIHNISNNNVDCCTLMEMRHKDQDKSAFHTHVLLGLMKTTIRYVEHFCVRDVSYVNHERHLSVEERLEAGPSPVITAVTAALEPGCEQRHRDGV